MYTPVDPKVNFPALEEEILDFWKKRSIFEKSIEQRADAEDFVFYDGPPFATGLPHFGHFVANTIKDIFPRYQTMKGKRVERRFGWDCHGLPVEYEMEKELGISGKTEIEKFGVAKFNESCRSIVLRYTKEWRSTITRLGRWVDFDNDYKTMEPDYMESIWWVVKQLWEKNLIYEGHYILPYCPRCSTVLSNHELNLGGYKDVHDPSITVRFKLAEEENTWFCAWTTTPWTLPSNLGLTLGPDIDYVKVKDGDEFFILAKERLSKYYPEPDECEILWTKKGSELLGIPYEPLFPYFADLKSTGAFRTFNAEYVTIEDGTGIVHTAPGFGEEDYQVFKGSDVPVIVPVDEEGRFTSEVSDFEGIFVKDADKEIIRKLKDEGKLIKREQYLHSYPHCWRCDSPLIYRAIGSWFVNVPEFRDRMIKHNKEIHWQPEHIRDGRFGKWLENSREWAISRNRYWGNPIPIWRCEECDEMICVGSRAELEELSGVKVDDLHKHFVDPVEIPCSCGAKMRRVPEVLDCWFESGAMPYAQVHYPYENKEWFENNYPAEFIAEGLDQTRGWFYTLTILAAALFDRPAFRNVVVNGLVLAADGKKMSKSLRNYTAPDIIFEKYGADALRLSLMNSAVVKAEGVNFSDNAVKDVLKGVLIPIWNAYSFFVTYANIDDFAVSGTITDPANPLDKWIISESEGVVERVSAQLDDYDIQKAIEPLVGFVDLLNNWYIRRSRRRFWKSENDTDKDEAYQTLFEVLVKFVKLAAPFIPFLTEAIYRNLRTDDMPESVHLCDYPVYHPEKRDEELEQKMRITRQAVSMGRALRAMHTLKTRQPLKSMHLVTMNQEEKRILREMEGIIREELNVKEVIFRENEDDLVEYSAKANFRVLGKQLGKNMKSAAAVIQELSGKEIQSLLDGATLSLDVENVGVLELTEGSVVISRSEKDNLKVLNDGSLTVALDPEITDELRQEGMVRDIIRGIQNLRKDSGLDVTDRIKMTISGSDEVKAAVEVFQDSLMEETLTSEWTWGEASGSVSLECGDETCDAVIEKA